MKDRLLGIPERVWWVIVPLIVAGDVALAYHFDGLVGAIGRVVILVAAFLLGAAIARFGAP